jgi:hypothetical protein
MKMIVPMNKANATVKPNGTASSSSSSSTTSAASMALEATSKMFYNNYYQQATNGFSVHNLLNNNIGQQSFETPTTMTSNSLIHQQNDPTWPTSSSSSTSPAIAYEYRTQFTKLFQQNNRFLNQSQTNGTMTGTASDLHLVDSQQFNDNNSYLLHNDAIKTSLINNENNYQLQQQPNDFYQHNGK